MFDELDAIIERSREVNLDDMSRCPYVEAVQLEVHRYIPAVYFLDAKLCNKDLVFEGYELPKGSLVCSLK